MFRYAVLPISLALVKPNTTQPRPQLDASGKGVHHSEQAVCPASNWAHAHGHARCAQQQDKGRIAKEWVKKRLGEEANPESESRKEWVIQAEVAFQHATVVKPSPAAVMSRPP